MKNNCETCKHFFMAQAYNPKYGEMADVPWCKLDDRMTPYSYICERWDEIEES